MSQDPFIQSKEPGGHHHDLSRLTGVWQGGVFEIYLPECAAFIQSLFLDYQHEEVHSHQDIRLKTDRFFSLKQMAEMDARVPGWAQMSGFAGGQNLYHIVTAMLALFTLPEYQAAGPAEQEMLKWIILLHDISKKPLPGDRDHLHGFLSGIAVANILPSIGFATTKDYQSHLAAWAVLTQNASIEKSGNLFQDNSKLSEILSGVDMLFGHGSPAALIVKTILLHISVEGVKDWPNPTPLTDDQVCAFLDPKLFRLLKVMALVDSDAWEFFNLQNRERFRQEILVSLDRWYELVQS